MLLKNIIYKNKSVDKIAIKYSKQELTYAELYINASNIARKLKENKYYCNNIGIFLPNSIEYAIAYFAITKADSVIVPIDVQVKKLELKSTINYCELGIIITNTIYKHILKSNLNEKDVQISIFNLDDNTFENIGKSQLDVNKCYYRNEIINDESVALMIHTSGTTNSPKRVMLTHKNLISNVQSNIESLKLSKSDKVLIALPMFFGYCNTAQFLTHLYLGASIVILDGMFFPNTFLNLIEEEKITNFTGVPTMLLMLLNYRNKTKYDISSLRYICFGGGLMPVEKIKLLIQTFPLVGFVQTYGQTEASPRVTALLPEDSFRKMGSVGKPIPNVKVRIVNEDGEDVGNNMEGEIIIQGNNVMKGYYKREIETLETIRNGWLYSGDLAIYDEEGYIYLIGRKKNVIISGGLNIYPEEIEELLLSCSSVKEVSVVGEKHEILSEVPIAKIVLEDHATGEIESKLKKICIDNLSNYKVPYRIEFVNEFLKTATGKIKRV